MATLRKRLAFTPVRKDAAKRQVFGWAYSSILDGQPVIDHDRDTIPPEELEKAAYNYVRLHRVGSHEHDRLGVSECIESIFVDTQKAKAMGLEPGQESARWWVGFQVHDESTWAAVEGGQLREFSIGGESIREPHPTVADAYVLKNLNINEIALVSQGAGLGVPVRVAKKKGINMEIITKAAKVAAKLNDEQAAVLKGLLAGKIEKGDLRPTLEAAGLDENQTAIVMGLLEAAMAEPGSAMGEPAAEPVEAEAAYSEDKMEEEKAEGEDDDETPMAKAMKAEVAKLRSEIAKERHLRRIEKARAEAKESFAGVPQMSPDHMAEVLIMIEDGVLGDAGPALKKALKATHELVKSGDDIFSSMGANGPGARRVHAGDVWDEISGEVEKYRAEGMSHSQAINKALEKNAAKAR